MNDVHQTVSTSCIIKRRDFTQLHVVCPGNPGVSTSSEFVSRAKNLRGTQLREKILQSLAKAQEPGAPHFLLLWWVFGGLGGPLSCFLWGDGDEPHVVKLRGGPLLSLVV